MTDDPHSPQAHGHPDDELLAAYLDGEAPVTEARAVEAHVAACAACREELALALHARSALASLPEPPAPGLAADWREAGGALPPGSAFPASSASPASPAPRTGHAGARTERGAAGRGAGPGVGPAPGGPESRAERRGARARAEVRRRRLTAALGALVLVAVVVGGGFLVRSSHPAETAASGGAAKLLPARPTRYDPASLAALATSLARNAVPTFQAPGAQPSPAPTSAHGAPSDAYVPVQGQLGGVAASLRPRELSCLRGLAGAPAHATLVFFARGSFRTTPALIGGFLDRTGPGRGHVTVVAVTATGCRLLSLVRVPVPAA